VTPAATTSYWSEVTNSCGAFARTETIVVTVQPCNAPQITIQPAGGQAVVGDPITIGAAVGGSTPLTLQWFEGLPSDTSRLVVNATSANLTAGPILAPTSFWLRATNECGTASSSAAQVVVVPNCIAPLIITQPADGIVAPGAQATLGVTATGTSLTYRWYQGAVFDFTKQVGVNPIIVTPAITTATQFWVRVTNNCGSANSTAVTLAPLMGRHRAVKH
jgi:hypothetical protein